MASRWVSILLLLCLSAISMAGLGAGAGAQAVLCVADGHIAVEPAGMGSDDSCESVVHESDLCGEDHSSPLLPAHGALPAPCPSIKCCGDCSDVPGISAQHAPLRTARMGAVQPAAFILPLIVAWSPAAESPTAEPARSPDPPRPVPASRKSILLI